jgi:hypothetical protein
VLRHAEIVTGRHQGPEIRRGCGRRESPRSRPNTGT